jgi:hypothetical protein
LTRRPLLIPLPCGSDGLIPTIGDQNDVKATAAGSEWFDPQHRGIKLSRWPIFISIPRGANDLDPQVGDEIDAKPTAAGSEWLDHWGEQIVWQATFDPITLWISWFDPHHWGLKLMRGPQLRDQNGLIPSIGGSNCREGHF